MTKNYQTLTTEITQQLGKLSKDIPDVMQNFHGLHRASGKAGVLDKKTKELIALGISIATRCDACIGFHTKALVQLGITREEFTETLGMAIYMGGGPSLMYAADALKAFEEFSE